MIGPTREHILRMPMNGSHCTMLCAVLISFVAGAPAVAQQGAADAMGDTALAPGAPRGGSEFWIPFGSFVIRGWVNTSTGSLGSATSIPSRRWGGVMVGADASDLNDGSHAAPSTNSGSRLSTSPRPLAC